MAKKIDIYDSDNYKYKAKEVCYMQGCQNVAEWWIEEDSFGICEECFQKLEEPKKTLYDKQIRSKEE